MNWYSRPVIGFIVEGDGEFKSYPSLVNRILDIQNCYIKALNAKGAGSIVNNLEKHLDDLVIHFKPVNVIITIDLRDNINDGTCQSCTHLVEILQNEIDNWYTKSRRDNRFDQLPNEIIPVIQIQTLESWFLADLDSLAELPEFNIDASSCNWQNVDDSISNPYIWLSQKVDGSFNLKSPTNVRTIFSRLNIEVMKSKSRSFSKFCREVEKLYKNWENLIENDE
jgi:hypothetical protein